MILKRGSSPPGLSLSPFRQLVGNREAKWSLFKFEPKNASDYAGKDDLYVSPLVSADLMQATVQGRSSFYSERFSPDEIFIYLKMDGAADDLNQEVFVDRSTIEDDSECCARRGRLGLHDRWRDRLALLLCRHGRDGSGRRGFADPPDAAGRKDDKTKLAPVPGCGPAIRMDRHLGRQPNAADAVPVRPPLAVPPSSCRPKENAAEVSPRGAFSHK